MGFKLLPEDFQMCGNLREADFTDMRPSGIILKVAAGLSHINDPPQFFIKLFGKMVQFQAGGTFRTVSFDNPGRLLEQPHLRLGVGVIFSGSFISSSCLPFISNMGMVSVSNIICSGFM